MNTLYYGDNLDILRRHIRDETVDLVYLDPPFKSNQDYNVLFAEKNGSQAAAQIKAFEDTWTWDKAAAESYQEIVEKGGRVSQAMQAFRSFLGTNDMLAYLSMMAPRLGELRRVLKPTGSIYLHCDPAASHYLKLLMDAVFAPEQFRNEIIWRRTGSNSAAKRFGPLHQTIFYYVKSKARFYPMFAPYTRQYVEEFFKDEDERGKYQAVALTGPGVRTGESGNSWGGYDPTKAGRHWQPASYVYKKYRELTGEDLAGYPLLERLGKLDEIGMIHWAKKTGGGVPRYKYYSADAPGVQLQDIWAFQPGTEGCVYGRPEEGIDQDVKWLSTQDKERLGYPTQKPEGLLERIIRVSSKEGELVLDPFCGCGTTIAVAQRLKRHWIGIDITHLAITLIKHRLHDTFKKVTYQVVGEPVSLPDAKTLAKQDKYQFQWWALGLVGARPVEHKRGSDKGIDGRLYFHDDPVGGKTKQIILSVKGGHTDVTDMRDLRGVIEREDAEIGVLITLEEPTKHMRTEAASSGFYDSPWGKRFPRLQILTIDELLKGKGIDYPPSSQVNVTFKKAVKIREHEMEEQDLPLGTKK